MGEREHFQIAIGALKLQQITRAVVMQAMHRAESFAVLRFDTQAGLIGGVILVIAFQFRQIVAGHAQLFAAP